MNSASENPVSNPVAADHPTPAPPPSRGTSDKGLGISDLMAQIGARGPGEGPIELERPSISHYPTVEGRRTPPGPGSLSVAFLGTSSLLIRAGRTALMIDGFFSRPPLEKMAAPIAPEHETIDACLARADVEDLDAVACMHSHYDHAMDSPVIAAKYRALLLGSESTANLGRGYGLPEELIRTVADGETLSFDDFDVTFVESVHSPGDAFPGQIVDPFSPPAPISAWATGACYSVFVKHATGTLLIHASANYLPGKLAPHAADAVYLGMGVLGKQDESFRHAYWDEVVRATGARTVLPIHWDDLMTPLGEGPLLPQPRVLDDIATALDFAFSEGEKDGRTVQLPTLWTPIAPLE